MASCLGFSALSPSRRRSSHSSRGARGRSATEVEWLGTYRAWSDGIGAALPTGLVISRKECETTFDEDVGDPPQQRLRPVAAAARRGCAALTPVGWRNGKADVVRALIDAHDDDLRPRRRRDISDIAGSERRRASPTSTAGSPPAGRRSPSSTRSSAAARRHRSRASPTTRGTASTSIPASALRCVSICAGCARHH